MDFIAVDWGTTNRRAFRIADGRAVDTVRDDRGVTAVAPGGYPAEVAALRARLGDLPLLCAGMVGSTAGWVEMPYVPVPCGLAAVAAATRTVAPGVQVVPGLSVLADGRADVMRGEEVQLLGALAADLVPAGSLLCQPGTHCKWAEAEGGTITRFVTAMTGELFALLRGHSLLARQLGGTASADAAFLEGVAEGARRDLAASLFGIRAAGLLGVRADAAATSYASGLLIGADVAARVGRGRHVGLIADPALGALYAAAIAAVGGTAQPIDSHAAFVAGIVRLRSMMG